MVARRTASAAPPRERVHLDRLRGPVDAGAHERRVPRRRDADEHARCANAASTPTMSARPLRSPLAPRQPERGEPDHAREQHGTDVRALYAQPRHQHEARDQRAGDGADGVDRVGVSGRVAAAAALQQPHRHREDGAQQHARRTDQERHRAGLARTAARASHAPACVPMSSMRCGSPGNACTASAAVAASSELQRAEAGQRADAREPRCDQRAAERDAEQVDAEHGRERVDGRTEHQPEQPHPGHLERQRAEARRARTVHATMRRVPGPSGTCFGRRRLRGGATGVVARPPAVHAIAATMTLSAAATNVRRGEPDAGQQHEAGERTSPPPRRTC